jgi:hypothetical protein
LSFTGTPSVSDVTWHLKSPLSLVPTHFFLPEEHLFSVNDWACDDPVATTSNASALAATRTIDWLMVIPPLGRQRGSDNPASGQSAVNSHAGSASVHLGLRRGAA